MLYRFDGVDEQLELIPMAARRALDRAGRRLSLEGWRSLPVPLRRNLVATGTAPGVDVDVVTEAAMAASPPAEAIDPIRDPDPISVPNEVIRVLGPDRAIPATVWAALSALDRYVIAKVCTKGREERIDTAFAEIIGHSSVSSHLSPAGGVRMVDVSSKETGQRRAVAESRITMSRDAFTRLQKGTGPKGDVLATARVAGIMAAKRTAELIPLCHPIALTRVSVEFELDQDESAVIIEAAVDAHDRTGVEMESLVAAMTSALTIYDMLKSIDRSMVIGSTQLLSKSGGRSGDFKR